MTRIFQRLSGATLLTGLVLAAGWAHADDAPATTMQARCFERGELLYILAAEQGERLSQTRRVGADGLLEAFKSPSAGSWTIVYSDGHGLSCIVAEGEGLAAEDHAGGRREFAV